MDSPSTVPALNSPAPPVVEPESGSEPGRLPAAAPTQSSLPVYISVVVPVYRAADCLSELYRRLTECLSQIGKPYELVLVDDCSPDETWPALRRFATFDPAVKAIKLSRNFGQHAAITAGISKAIGSWIVVMDCDLGDPPEDIVRLLQKAEAGFDLVLARRTTRQHDRGRVFLSRTYFRLLSWFAHTSNDGEYGSFSIISRKVADAYLTFSDKNRHYLLILFWLGFNRGHIDYDHKERFAGKSSYTLLALCKHALQGLLFQTTVLLQTIIAVGFLVSFCGLAYAAYIIYSYLMHSAFPGWTSLAVLILVLSGIILISLGIVGLYVGQIFEQVKARPLFVVEQSLGTE